MTASPLGLNSMMKDLSLAGIESIQLAPKDVRVILAPGDVKVILEDLKIIAKLQNVRITAGDLGAILPNRGWGRESRSSPIVPYNTLQELLEELKTLPDTYDEEKWMKFSKPFMQHNANMDMAKRIRTWIPDIVSETHRVIAGLTAQLSRKARDCLKDGMKFQDLEQAWNTAIVEANNYFR
jgi:hypothetical protein